MVRHLEGLINTKSTRQYCRGRARVGKGFDDRAIRYDLTPRYYSALSYDESVHQTLLSTRMRDQ